MQYRPKVGRPSNTHVRKTNLSHRTTGTLGNPSTTSAGLRQGVTAACRAAQLHLRSWTQAAGVAAVPPRDLRNTNPRTCRHSHPSPTLAGCLGSGVTRPTGFWRRATVWSQAPPVSHLCQQPKTAVVLVPVPRALPNQPADHLKKCACLSCTVTSRRVFGQWRAAGSRVVINDRGSGKINQGTWHGSQT